MVGALSGATLLLWVGGSAILPLLPRYLRHEGSSPALVGVVMAAYFAASVATQYPVGRLSDRIGRRPVVLGGLVLFSLGSLGFALVAGAGPAIVSRALQGIGAGSVTVAAAATIGTEVGASERGAAFGALYGSQMLALAVGPLVGSIVGERSMSVLFVAAAIAALLAAAPVVAVIPGGRATLAGRSRAGGEASEPSARGTLPTTEEELEVLAGCAPGGVGHRPPGERERGDGRRTARARLPLSPAFVGVLAVFAATGLLGGVYESCWTLLMTLRHASSFEIGLSWTLFALPFAVLSVPAGRLANRADPRALVLGSLACSGAFCTLYPLLHDVPLMVAFGAFEAVGAVVGSPAALLVLVRSVPPTVQGEAQGSVETARTAATALAAAVSGALFGFDPVAPFALGTALVVVAAGGVAWSWRYLPVVAPLAGGEPAVTSGATGSIASGPAGPASR
jgi:MFS family permease